VTSPYSPDTATAILGGVTSAGYVEGSAPTWDDPTVAAYNAQAIEQRAALLALDARANLAALRADLGRAAVATVKIMCVGDSITLGTGSTDGNGYRPWLADLLGRQHIDAPMTTVAEGGQTLRHMAPLAIAALPTTQPDIVLIHLGTNDAVQPDLTDWQNRYGQLVDQILASSPTIRVVCARIGLTRQAPTADSTINGYVDAVVNARKAAGRVTTADMTVISQRWTVDGIHPLDAGYLRMAQQWATAIGPWLAP